QAAARPRPAARRAEPPFRLSPDAAATTAAAFVMRPVNPHRDLPMKRYLPLALLLAVPAVAQHGGMANMNAPTLTQSYTSGDTKISLNYTSIAWVRGDKVKTAMDKANGADARKEINELAKSKPIGTFTTSADLVCGDLKIPAGD